MLATARPNYSGPDSRLHVRIVRIPCLFLWVLRDGEQIEHPAALCPLVRLLVHHGLRRRWDVAVPKQRLKNLLRACALSLPYVALTAP